jgi:hypothetical protein
LYSNGAPPLLRELPSTLEHSVSVAFSHSAAAWSSDFDISLTLMSLGEVGEQATWAIPAAVRELKCFADLWLLVGMRCYRDIRV